MSRAGKKTISVEEEYHEKIKHIAERNGIGIQDAVIYAFKNTFPADFPEKTIA